MYVFFIEILYHIIKLLITSNDEVFVMKLDDDFSNRLIYTNTKYSEFVNLFIDLTNNSMDILLKFFQAVLPDDNILPIN